MSSARQAAQFPVPQPIDLTRLGDDDVHSPPSYARLHALGARLRAPIINRKALLFTASMLVIVDFFAESSDIAQIAEDVQQTHGTQNSAQTGISAWGLFSHSAKIIALFIYLSLEARQRLSVFPAMNQHLDDGVSSQLSGPDLSAFMQSGRLELGHAGMNSVRTHHPPTPHLRPISLQASTSSSTSPHPPEKAYVQATRASPPSGALHVTDEIVASPAPPEHFQMETFQDHSQLPRGPTRPPRLLVRPHLPFVRPKVIDQDSIFRALPGAKRGQRRRDNLVDHSTTSPHSPTHPPKGLDATLEPASTHPAPDSLPREHTGNIFLPIRPSSASPGAEGPLGPVMIRQV